MKTDLCGCKNVGWVKRSATHHFPNLCNYKNAAHFANLVGFASLHPPYSYIYNFKEVIKF